MPGRRAYRCLFGAVFVLALALNAPSAQADVAPVCADVMASVQNITDPDDIKPDPMVTVAAACADADPGTTLRYVLASEPSGGYAVGNPAGFSYFPRVGFSGTDSFTYVAEDATHVSNPATITVTVLPPPEPDPDADRDGVLDDDCPDVPGSSALRGCPDRDGDGIADEDDGCPDTAATGSDDGCPPVVGERAWGAESRRQARRLQRRWHRSAERARAWRTSRIAITVRVPQSAAQGRQLRVGASVRIVRRRSDGLLPTVMFGKGVRCEGGQSCRVTLRLRPFGFKFARHRSLEFQLILSPHDGHGAVESVVPLKLAPRR